MAKQRFYAVRKGFNPGIYETLDKFNENTKGYSGSEGKAFNNKEDARMYMREKRNVVKPKYYAIKKGKVPGIYRTAKDFQENTKGYSGFNARVFKTYEEAEYYMITGLDYKTEKQKNSNLKEEKKYYAVRIGFIPGIYRDLDSFLKNTNGYRNAEAKSFYNKADAEAYMSEVDRKSSSSYMCDLAISLSKKENSVSIYSDGSWGFNENNEKIYVGGFLVIENGCIIDRVCVAGNDELYTELENVAGELYASVSAIEYVEESMPHIDNLYIFVDYVGSLYWSIPESEGGWKRKSFFSKKYSDYIEEMKNLFRIKFFHVKGHSEDYFNKEADRLSDYSKHIHTNNKKFDLKTFLDNHSYIGEVV